MRFPVRFFGIHKKASWKNKTKKKKTELFSWLNTQEIYNISVE